MTIRFADKADCAAITEIYNHAVLHTAAIWNDRTVDTDNRLAWYEARQLLGYPVLVSEENGVVTGYASFAGIYRYRANAAGRRKIWPLVRSYVYAAPA